MLVKHIDCPRCNGTGKIPDDKDMGEEFRKMRIAKGLSLREISKLMGLSAQYICDLEHGRRIWSDGLQERYNKALE